MRAIGRLEKSDWNFAAIERKIEDNPRVTVSGEAERVPKWNKESYEEKVGSLTLHLVICLFISNLLFFGM